MSTSWAEIKKFKVLTSRKMIQLSLFSTSFSFSKLGTVMATEENFDKVVQLIRYYLPNKEDK